VTKRYTRYALAVIFFANLLSYLDRMIIGAIEKALSEEIGLTKDEFGWVASFFTIGYMVFAPIVGFMTERFKRPRIFAVCVFLWSLATLGSGFAHSKHVLYVMRFFIGIGEAGCLVIGPSLLCDYFSKEVRGKALSVFFLALPVGGTLGYIVGGILTQYFSWRHAFYFAGIPGFAIAVLIWLLIDPPRGGTEKSDQPASPGKDPPILGSGPAGAVPAGLFQKAWHAVSPYISLLKNQTLLLIIVAQAFAVFFLQPLMIFGVGYFQDSLLLSPVEANLTLGIIALVAGGLGNMLSGVIGDRMARRRKGAYALLAGIGFSMGFPFLAVGFLLKSPWLALPALGAGAFCYFLCMPAVNTQIANSVSFQQRAMAYALAVFILHFLGDTFAPPLFGKAVILMGNQTQKTFLLFSCSLLFAGGACFLASRRAHKDEPPDAGSVPPATHA